ncbi:MAG: ferritin [Flavobacteriales bacterium]|nr:ferritin [Flavobacteriales bacterium]MCX7649168.1 ferritin [Flavobacteriales bacterium]MDW8432641.1 ferritin [Flavobacteriales bacterium]
MLPSEIEKRLNEQVARESASSALYLSMASWCESHSLDGCAAFLYRQSDEERTHMLKLMKYINDAGGHALVPAVPQPKTHFSGVREVFEDVLASESSITQSIHELVDLCTRLKDYTTLHFLQWYVTEQHEEEKLSRTILDKLNILGTESPGLYLFDKEITSLKVDTQIGASPEA